MPTAGLSAESLVAECSTVEHLGTLSLPISYTVRIRTNNVVLRRSDPEAVLYTNVLVDVLRSRKGASWHILDLVHQEQIQMHLTIPLTFEYEEVLLRHRPVAGWSRRETLAFLGLLVGKASRHKVYYLWREHADDSKDAHVLEAAVASGTSRLVTFNTGDFKTADQFGIEVLTPGEFLRAIE